MSSSVIFPRHEENISFQQSSGQGFGTSRLDSMMGKGKSLELSSEDSLETAEDKRKREIGSIKEELNKLNRRMEHFNFKKPGDEANNQSKAGEDGQSKPYFQLPSRKAPTTQSPQEKSGDAHLNAFKNFASGSSGSSSSSTAPSYSTPSTPNYTNPSSGYTNYSGVPGKGNEGVAQLQVRPEAQMQHSLSDNEIRTQAPKREEPGNMFKKKVMTYEPDQSHTAPAAKTFLLSPKGQPPSLPFQSTSIKSPAETVQLPSPGKALRRVDSTTHEAPEEKKEKVREFCKDDFVVGKKLGKGQFG